MARHRKLTQKFAGFPMFKLGTSGDTFPITSPFTSEFVGLDGLSLDLQFAADKTLTARKGPTPVFTRASTATFVGSNGLIQSAAVNAPRFDHDPVTLACKGLLIEESRTNVALYSGAIVNNIGWGGNLTPSVSGSGPDGNSSYQLSETATTSLQSMANTGSTSGLQGTSVVAGATYTSSIFVKKVAGNIDWMQITFGGAGFGAVLYANFNIGTGTVGNFAGLASGTVPRIEAYGDGWYRLSVAATATATIATNNVIIGFIQNTNGTARLPSYLGSPANKVLAAMGQFEAGTFATSYIPTLSSSVVRSADVCSITGSAFTGFYNPVEGSFATSSIFNAPTSYAIGQIVIDVNDTTNLNRFRTVRGSPSGVVYYSNTVGGIQDVAIIGPTSIAAGAVAKLAGCMKVNDFAVYLNNVSQGVDTVALMQASPTTLTIGEVSAGTTAKAPLNGTISAIRYFRKRLPNEKLQALTV